jgi:hypothetical protein
MEDVELIWKAVVNEGEEMLKEWNAEQGNQV